MFLGSSSSNLIFTVELPKSVRQFVGLILNCESDNNETNYGPLKIFIVKGNPSGSIDKGSV